MKRSKKPTDFDCATCDHNIRLVRKLMKDKKRLDWMEIKRKRAEKTPYGMHYSFDKSVSVRTAIDDWMRGKR